MEKLDKDLLVKRLTEMIEKGEEFLNISKNLKKDFQEFEDEIMILIDEDPILIKLGNRMDKIMSFFEGYDDEE
jgi:hypothetical protein